VSVVLAVAIALLAVTAAVTIHRRSYRVRIQVRATRAGLRATQDRVPRWSEEQRKRLERLARTTAHWSAGMSAADRWFDEWLSSLVRGRVAVEHLTDRRLAPLVRMVRIVEAAARYAALWRNPLG
jgi:hypothetical protein